MEQDKQGEEKKLPEAPEEKKASLEGLSPFTRELLEETFEKMVAERKEATEAAQKKADEGASRVEKREGTQEQISKAKEAGEVLIKKVDEAAAKFSEEVEKAKAGEKAETPKPEAPKAEAPEKPVASLDALAKARARGDWDEVARMNNELSAEKSSSKPKASEVAPSISKDQTIEDKIAEAKGRGDTEEVSRLNNELWKREMAAKGRPTELGRAGVVPDKPKEEQKYPPVPAELPKTSEPDGPPLNLSKILKGQIPPIPKSEVPKAPEAEKKEVPTHKEEPKHEEAHEAPHAEAEHDEVTPPDVVRALNVSEIRAEEPVLTEREKEVQSELRKISTDGNFDLKNLEDPKKLAKLLKLEKGISEEEKLRRLQIGFDAAVNGLGESSERYADIQKAFEKGSEGIKGEVLEEKPKPVETIEPEKKEIEGEADALNLAALKEASDKAKQKEKTEEPKEVPKQKPEFTREQAEKFAKLSLPPERKGRLREFAEGVKETALEKWEEFKKEVSFPAKNTIDKFRMMWNDRAFDRHTVRAEEAYREVVTANDKIAVAEAQLRSYDAERAAVRSRLGGVDTAATARLAIKERKELVKTVEKLKVERRGAQERLENQNRFRAMFENKRKNIAREFHERIKDRLDPIESRIKEARGARDKFDAEVESFALTTEKNEARLEALQQGMKEAWSKVDKLQYSAAIKETKEALRTGRKMLSLRLEKRGELERVLTVLETNASPYRVKINELALLSKRDEVYQSAGPKADEKPDWSFRNPDNESANTVATEQQGEDEAESPKEERSENRVDLERLVSGWNNYFGSEMNIQSGRMQSLGAKASAGFGSYERLIIAYWKRMQEAGNTRLTEKKIRANIKFLKVALANESNE